MNFDRTSIDLIEQTIGDRDIFGKSSAETENGPARAEGAVGDHDIFAAAKERTGIVLGLDIAVDYVDKFAADKMKAIIISIHAVMNAHAICVDVMGLNKANRVISAAQEEDVLDNNIFALIEEQAVWPLQAAAP